MYRTPDLTRYQLAHDAMRRSARQLADALAAMDRDDASRARALRWWCDGFIGELHAHHTVEDDLFFPALAERVPTFAEEHDAGLATEHEELAAVMGALRDAVRHLAEGVDVATHQATASAHAEELATFLDHHLGIEDDEVLPLFARHFTAEEYERLDDQALKSIGLRQLLFTVPWAVCAGDPDTRAQVLADAPAPVRAIWALTRRRYVRRATLALGTPVVEVAR
jgi:hypothetical protein